MSLFGPPAIGRRIVVFSVVNPDGSLRHVWTELSDAEFRDLAGPKMFTRIVKPGLRNLVTRAEAT